LSCYKAWDSHSSAALIANYGNNWRHMFVERVRPNFNGAYISRTTYIRQGEASFQDVHYRPCYLVEYYRYIRFFPNGRRFPLESNELSANYIHIPSKHRSRVDVDHR
jgi:F-box protein 9